MKILLIDDHTMFREALLPVFKQLDKDVIVIEASCADEGLNVAEYYEELDLVLLDLYLPDKDGLKVLLELRDKFPTLPVIIISSIDEIPTIEKAMNIGAMGYIPKTSSLQEMQTAIRLVLNGDVYLPKQLLGNISKDPLLQEKPTNNEPCPTLTNRQKEVLTLIAHQGLSNKLIASRLDISEGTVKEHIRNILDSLQVTNRTQAVLKAQRLGIFDCL